MSPHDLLSGGILSGEYAPPRIELWPRKLIRVVDWNIDRGTRLESVLHVLKSLEPDLIFLQEVDLNTRRTKHQDIARSLAASLKMNYVWGLEFVELSQGTKNSPAFQGQATLSRWNLRNPRLIRFAHQSDFWHPHWYLKPADFFQERRGGRIALCTEVQAGSKILYTYNLHLESKGPESLRLSQLEATVSDAGQNASGCRCLLAGDLNLNASIGTASEVLRKAGFRDAIGQPREHTRPTRDWFESGRVIDWIFSRGEISTERGSVCSFARGSDHYPLLATLSLA